MPKVYQVKTTKKDEKRFEKLDPILLKPPFFIVINSPPRTGKSNLLVNIIYNLYEDMFDDIIFISPNVFNDDSLENNVAEDETITKIHDNLDQLGDIIDSIVEVYKNKRIENNHNKKPNEHVLLILDDCLGMIPNTQMNKLVSKYRHYCISVIITTQSFRAVNNIIRTCATGYILFKNSNNKEIQKMDDEFSGSFENFLDLYKEATKEKYNFLFLDFRNIKAYKNFDTLLYEKE